MFQDHLQVIRKVINLTVEKELIWEPVTNNEKVLLLLEMRKDDMMNGDFAYRAAYSNGFFYFTFYYGAYHLIAQSGTQDKIYRLDASYQDLLETLLRKIRIEEPNSNERFLNEFLNDN